MQPAKAPVGFFVGDELAFVLDNPRALGNRPQGEHAAAVNRRGRTTMRRRGFLVFVLFIRSRILRRPSA